MFQSRNNLDNEKLVPPKLKLCSTAFILSHKCQNPATKRHEIVMEIFKASNEAGFFFVTQISFKMHSGFCSALVHLCTLFFFTRSIFTLVIVHSSNGSNT